VSPDRDYYTALGVPRGAAEEEIKRLRRKVLRELHPDANGGGAEAAERFDAACKMFAVLGDPVRRRLYDQELDPHAPTGVLYSRKIQLCDACGGSGLAALFVCQDCGGLGRQGMGFTPNCETCNGVGRIAEDCSSCAGRGWR